LGPMIFERCSARQIEATNVNGAIVYDRGSFEPGLARFDSLKGDVAIGVASGAQLDGRAASGGRVYTLFDQHAQVNAREGAASALVDGGGPTVNATSGSGNVYLYDGSLRARNRVPAEWQPPLGVLHGNPRNEEAPQSGPPARSAAPHRVVAPSPHFAGHR
ncbi:MAG TPA: hypothetical protein VKG44_05885, partial [Candidatus Baltobacteraceae bacterium]|nr:hypothetical protein [Candidatus Baltobacteraceae bacterium]